MQALSISSAWDETRAILLRDGRLFASVALALVGLPAAIIGVVNPSGVSDTSTPLWIDLVAVLASLIALAGQLALIRLALTPGEAVGTAISHGLRRMPLYFLAVLLLLLGLLIAAIPFGAVLVVSGVPLERTADAQLSPAILLAMLLYVALVIFVAVRFILSAPVASAEATGVIGILKRSWRLTSGHWLRLFAFLALFFLGAIVLLVAAGSAVGVVVGLLLGPIEPWSASALVLALVQALLNAAVTVLFTVMLARIYAQLAGRSDAQAGVPNSGI